MAVGFNAKLCFVASFNLAPVIYWKFNKYKPGFSPKKHGTSSPCPASKIHHSQQSHLDRCFYCILAISEPQIKFYETRSYVGILCGLTYVAGKIYLTRKIRKNLDNNQKHSNSPDNTQYFRQQWTTLTTIKNLDNNQKPRQQRITWWQPTTRQQSTTKTTTLTARDTKLELRPRPR